MKPLPSIRRRLSMTLVVVSIAWGLAVSVVVGLTVRHEVDEVLDGALQESAEILSGLMAAGALQLPLAAGNAAAAMPNEHLVWQIVGPGGRVMLRSHQAPAEPLVPARQPGLSSVGDRWRVYGLALPEGGHMLYVAQRGADRDEARLEAAEVSAVLALLVGLACALWLRMRVRGELEPIEAMSAAVARFDPVGPAAETLAAARAELEPMRDAINGLGTRLARQLAAERAFSAHAAHALRTPLAGMVAQLAVAQRKSPPEAQPHLQRTRAAADRLQRVVTALLTLFRTGHEVQRRPVDVADLLAHLPFEGLALRADGDARIDADADLLSAALLNLLDNAQQAGARTVTVRADAGRLIVSDDGPGLADADRAALESLLADARYERPVGLGLMLADVVARAHGGRLRLAPGGPGFGIELLLGPEPAAPGNGA